MAKKLKNPKKTVLKKSRKAIKKPSEALFKIKPLDYNPPATLPPFGLAPRTKKVKIKKPSKPAKPLVKKAKSIKVAKPKKSRTRAKLGAGLTPHRNKVSGAGPKLVKPIELPIYKARIKVIGIGGGGNSIVSEIASEVKKVNFVVVNTDKQALRKVPQKIKRFQIGQKIAGGLGTGMNSELGEKIALEEKEKTKELLKGVDFCILVSSLGGGIGSGASPVFADISRRLRIKTLGIFTLPFDFEGRERMEIAKDSLEKLAPNLNALVIIPNQKIFQIVEKNTSLKEAFSTVNKFLAQILEGLIEMIYSSGLIKVGLADLKSILEGRGKLAFLNTVEAKGPDQLEEVVKNVLSNPLCPYSLKEATGILFSVAGGLNLSMGQVEQIGKTISEATNPKAKIAFGITQDKEKKIKITLLANGCKWEEWARAKEKSKTTTHPPHPPGLSSKGRAPKTKEEPKIEKPKKAKKLKELKKLPQTLVSPSPLTQKPESGEVKLEFRRNALEIKKATEEEEKKLLAQERKWETPAFLRRNFSSQTITKKLSE